MASQQTDDFWELTNLDSYCPTCGNLKASSTYPQMVITICQNVCPQKHIWAPGIPNNTDAPIVALGPNQAYFSLVAHISRLEYEATEKHKRDTTIPGLSCSWRPSEDEYHNWWLQTVELYKKQKETCSNIFKQLKEYINDKQIKRDNLAEAGNTLCQICKEPSVKKDYCMYWTYRCKNNHCQVVAKTIPNNEKDLSIITQIIKEFGIVENVEIVNAKIARIFKLEKSNRELRAENAALKSNPQQTSLPKSPTDSNKLNALTGCIDIHEIRINDLNKNVTEIKQTLDKISEKSEVDWESVEV